MIRVIGNLRCLNCEIVKQTLKKKDIEFSYEIFDQLTDQEQIELSEMAKLKGIMKMPLILKDNKLITTNEL